MISDIEEIYTELFNEIMDDCFDYKTVKIKPSEWVEKNLVLPKESSRIPGNYKYDNSPYVRELIDMMHPSDPTRIISVMKGGQSGITTGLMVPFMMWCIVNHPANILFTSKDKDIARRTMRTKFDLFMQKSGYIDKIRSNNIKAGNKRTGDTDFLKEYAGGSMIVESTQNIQNFREFAAKYVLIDEFDTAKASDKKEGSLRSTIEARQNSYGNLAKTVYVSTPTITQTSNIYKVYLEGDQRKWHWPCPSCGEFVPVEWQTKKDSKYYGIVWDLDNKKKLVKDSVRFRFSCCGHEIRYNEKHEINRKGKFIPTAEPIEPNIVSININSIILPPGFINWDRLVMDWLRACPPGKSVKVDKLKAFNFTHLGLPFEEKGKSPNILNIISNSRPYKTGVIPDELSKKDGNGEIILLTIAADLGGIMNNELEDVRLDWSILAHTETGATYSIDQGSIGTFKRKRTRTKKELEDDTGRIQYTYHHGLSNSVWNEFTEIVKKIYPSESGYGYKIQTGVIDTGHFTSLAYQYINSFEDDTIDIFGVKGISAKDYRKYSQDTSKVKKSNEINNLYLLQVDLLKDELSSNMELKLSDQGTQQPGFMNFPQPRGDKYSVSGYFKHFESERRVEVRENGEVVGFRWEKKSSGIENHFLDVEVYNLAARYILLDLYKRADPKTYRYIDWSMYVKMSLS